MSRQDGPQGKMKIRKSALKRFKITATGKVMMRSQNIRHLKRHKSKKALRAGRVPLQLKGKFAKKIKLMLGFA
ncbi:MAG: bL35 family ribosomal protein [Patescibacteria group bacterium]